MGFLEFEYAEYAQTTLEDFEELEKKQKARNAILSAASNVVDLLFKRVTIVQSVDEDGRLMIFDMTGLNQSELVSHRAYIEVLPPSQYALDRDIQTAVTLSILEYEILCDTISHVKSDPNTQ